MKILVISLLRMGDTLMNVPLLNAIRDKYPDGQLDLLTFSVSRPLREMLPIVDNWWSLDYSVLQSGLGETRIPMFTSEDILNEQISTIAGQHYDWIINTTQTKLSGYLTAQIPSEIKLGLSLSSQGSASFGSPWFRYLNERANIASEDIFHYVDIFMNAAGFFNQPRDWTLFSPSISQSEIAGVADHRKKVIVIQLTTSDPKKNWPIEKWTSLIERLQYGHENRQIILLGAPFEREMLNTVKCSTQSENVDLAIVSMSGALALLKEADLLITGDTSIKHLANSSDQCAVVELSLGSSDWRRTGAYKPGAYIVHSTVECSPCSHSKDCHQPSFLCGDSLSVEMIESVASHALGDKTKELVSHPGCRVARVDEMGRSLWWASTVLEGQESICRVLDRISWQLCLNELAGDEILRFGSRGHCLWQELSEGAEAGDRERWMADINQREADIVKDQTEAEFERRRFLRKVSQTESTIDLQVLRHQVDQMKMAARKRDIEVRLLRALRTQMQECEE